MPEIQEDGTPIDDTESLSHSKDINRRPSEEIGKEKEQRDRGTGTNILQQIGTNDEAANRINRVRDAFGLFAFVLLIMAICIKSY